MVTDATIKRILTKRTYQTEKGTFTAQSILLEAEEIRQQLNGSTTSYRHTFIAELTGEKAETFNLPVGTKVSVALFFSANAFKDNPDKYFQSVRILFIRPIED